VKSDGLTDIVGELSSETSLSSLDLAAFEHSCAGCFKAHRVVLVRVLLARNRKRAILLFRAPDAESVRVACNHAKKPMARVWPCDPVSSERQTETNTSSR